jgi:hypothetical protein
LSLILQGLSEYSLCTKNIGFLSVRALGGETLLQIRWRLRYRLLSLIQGKAQIAISAAGGIQGWGTGLALRAPMPAGVHCRVRLLLLSVSPCQPCWPEHSPPFKHGGKKERVWIRVTTSSDTCEPARLWAGIRAARNSSRKGSAGLTAIGDGWHHQWWPWLAVSTHQWFLARGTTG